MEKIKGFFKELTILDYIIYITSLLGVIISSIIVKSSPLTIIYCIVGIFYIRLMARQYKISVFLGIIYVGIYIAQSAIYHNWGEVIIYGAISLPILIISNFAWFTGKNKNTSKISNKPISGKEWLILTMASLAISVGAYFLLDFFDTPSLIVATISFLVGLIGNYLILRQDGKMFFFFIALNILQIIIWILPVAKGESGASIEILPMIITLAAALISNIQGAIQWLKKPRDSAQKAKNNENNEIISNSNEEQIENINEISDINRNNKDSKI